MYIRHMTYDKGLASRTLAAGAPVLRRQVALAQQGTLEPGLPALRRQVASQTLEGGAPAIRGGFFCHMSQSLGRGAARRGSEPLLLRGKWLRKRR